MYRYTYGKHAAVPVIFERRRTDSPMHIGAIFANLQPVPNLGAWDGSECKSYIHNNGFYRHTSIISQCPFFSEHSTDRRPPRRKLSSRTAFKTAFANFAKNPNRPPAPHWPPYEREVSGRACTPTLAKIAYEGNVDFGNFVRPVQPNSTVSTRN